MKLVILSSISILFSLQAMAADISASCSDRLRRHKTSIGNAANSIQNNLQLARHVGQTIEGGSLRLYVAADDLQALLVLAENHRTMKAEAQERLIANKICALKKFDVDSVSLALENIEDEGVISQIPKDCLDVIRGYSYTITTVATARYEKYKMESSVGNYISSEEYKKALNNSELIDAMSRLKNDTKLTARQTRIMKYSCDLVRVGVR